MAEKQNQPRAIKMTHSQQLRQLVAENTILKQRLIQADKEQRSIDYWKAIVNVVVIELQKIDKEKIEPDTPFGKIIDQVAENIVKQLAEREKAMAAGKHFNKKNTDDKTEEQ